MIDINENPRLVEKAFLVGIKWPRQMEAPVREHLDELAQLMETLGAPVVGTMIASLHTPRPALILGTGKAEEILAECRMLEADAIVFDDDLSPTQQRNWEKLAELTVIDRREVILDIFAKRAQTREATLQVRLAQLEYQLPRLRKAWTHLERQRGGAGLRSGAGELQLEMDQRRIRDYISSIKIELAEVRRHRTVQRKQRLTKALPNAAIVGYTNAGKSSLMNALTGADVLVEDQLFATLDPTTRRIVLPNNQEMLLTDTVGFIRKLPHGLIESFKATLEETRLADYLIHVVDASHPKAMDQIKATNVVLEELGVRDKPTLLLLNKTDLIEDPSRLLEFRALADRVVPISATLGRGIDEMLQALVDLQAHGRVHLILEAPQSRYDIVSLAHREGNVLFEGYEGSSVWLEVEAPIRFHENFKDFIRQELPESLRPSAPPDSSESATDYE